MSPVSRKRRFHVGCLDWTVFGTVVEASTAKEAIAKAEAMREANGFEDFSAESGGTEAWEAREIAR